MTEPLRTCSRRSAASARLSPAEILVPPCNGAHGLDGKRRSPFRVGIGTKRRAPGLTSRAGGPGGSSSYAESENPTRPIGFRGATILRSALTIILYDPPVMLYEK